MFHVKHYKLKGETMVKIGHARFSEKGNAEGKRGDQTGKEVAVTDWYDGTWTTVYRPQSSEKASIIVKTMKEACENDNIGYGQGDRLTLMKAAEQCEFCLSDITEQVNCDCSSLVAVCCNAAGIAVPFSMTTRNEDSCLMGTGEFIRLQDSKYRNSDKYLRAGDILRKNGHTCIALTNGEGFKESYELHNSVSIYADNKNPDFTGIYSVSTDLYLREGAGQGHRAVAVVKFGDFVYNYGYYSYDEKGKVWYFVDYYKDGKKLTGFVSSHFCFRYAEIKEDKGD